MMMKVAAMRRQIDAVHEKQDRIGLVPVFRLFTAANVWAESQNFREPVIDDTGAWALGQRHICR